MLSDEWLSRYGLLENFNASVTCTGTRTRTGTGTTRVTAIALCTSCSRAKYYTCIPLHIPVLLYTCTYNLKVGFRGYSLHGHVFLMNCPIVLLQESLSSSTMYKGPELSRSSPLRIIAILHGEYTLVKKEKIKTILHRMIQWVGLIYLLK